MQIDLLAEINQSPRILSEVDGALKLKQMKADVDEYLKVLLLAFTIYMNMHVSYKKKNNKTATQYSDSCC